MEYNSPNLVTIKNKYMKAEYNNLYAHFVFTALNRMPRSPVLYLKKKYMANKRNHKSLLIHISKSIFSQTDSVWV
jgi:hypothetical protein